MTSLVQANELCIPLHNVPKLVTIRCTSVHGLYSWCIKFIRFAAFKTSHNSGYVCFSFYPGCVCLSVFLLFSIHYGLLLQSRTWSIPICPLRSHALVYSENNSYFVGIGPIIDVGFQFNSSVILLLVDELVHSQYINSFMVVISIGVVIFIGIGRFQ